MNGLVEFSMLEFHSIASYQCRMYGKSEISSVIKCLPIQFDRRDDLKILEDFHGKEYPM